MTLNVLDLHSGRSRVLRHLTTPSVVPPRFSPDGEKLLFGDSRRPGRMFPLNLYVIGVGGGRAIRIDRTTDRTVGSADWLDNGTVVYTQQHQTSMKLRSAPVTGKPGKTLVHGPGSVSCFAVARTARRLFYAYSENAKPGQVYSLDLEAGDPPRQLTDLNRHYNRIRLSAGELIQWKAPDGLTIEGWLYRPTTRTRPPYATIVIPHGGPQGVIGNDFARSVEVQPYCAAGYAIFLPNFRGSTGYGEAFMRHILNNWGPGPADDILAGIRALVRRKIADPNRLLLRGGSFGGYMTSWLVGHTDLFRAAVAHAPVVNNISMWGTTDIPCFQEWNLNGTPLTQYRRYWQLSPVAHLKRCTTPTLVITGDQDERVPPNQSYELYRTLKAVGVPTGLVLYPREPHGIGEPKHRLDVIRRTLTWFRKHLGGEAPDAR